MYPMNQPARKEDKARARKGRKRRGGGDDATNIVMVM
jgi:hypothetical protein